MLNVAVLTTDRVISEKFVASSAVDPESWRYTNLESLARLVEEGNAEGSFVIEENILGLLFSINFCTMVENIFQLFAELHVATPAGAFKIESVEQIRTIAYLVGPCDVASTELS